MRTFHLAVHQGKVNVVHVWQHKYFLEDNQNKNCGLGDDKKECFMFFLFYFVLYYLHFHLELFLELLFNPLSHMTGSHLSLPQFWTHMQVQLGRHREAVPAGRNHQEYCVDFLTNGVKDMTVESHFNILRQIFEYISRAVIRRKKKEHNEHGRLFKKPKRIISSFFLIYIIIIIRQNVFFKFSGSFAATNLNFFTWISHLLTL